MQLGVMDDLLEVAEEELRDDMGVVEMDEGEGPGRTSSLMWKCGEHYDQFYRRQVIYPITEYGLGNPYGAEDGALDGDSSGLTVYQTCSAVRTACTGDSGCVRFAHQGKLIEVSEVVFSDDRRLFHHDKVRFEQLGRVRLQTTTTVGGMANRSKLDAFILELEDGQVMQREKEVEVGCTITSCQCQCQCQC